MGRIGGAAIGNLTVSSSGSDGAILDGVSASIKATVFDLASANPLTVAIVDSTGAQITNLGGGTQYTEGDVDASITGTATMMEVAGNTLQPIQGTVADGLLVNLGTNNDVVVSATNLDIRDLTSVSDSVEVKQATGTNLHVVVDTAPTTAVTGTFWQATQPVSLASVPSHAVTNAGTFAVQVDALPTRDDEDFNEDAGTDTHQARGLYLSGFAAAATVLRDDSGFGENTTGGVAMVHSRLWDGAAYDRWPGNSTDGALVNLGANNDVTITSGTITTVTTLTGTTTLTPGTAAANLGKAEDAIHASGDVGVMALGVGNVAQTTLAADGDYIPQAVDVAGNSLVVGNAAAGATDSGNPVKVGGINNTTLPTLTNGQRGDLQLTTRGSLRVVLTDATTGTSGLLADNVDGLVTSATANKLATSSKTYFFNGTTWDRMRGNTTNGLQVYSGTAAGDLGKAEDNAHTSGDTGVMALGIRDDTLGVTSSTEGDYEPFHTNENGALWVETTPSTKGGWLVANFTSGDTYTALTNGAQVIKGSAGKFGGYYIYNPNAAVSYVMVYNIAAASVTVGSSTAILVFAIPPTSAANLELLAGIPFSTAMSIAAATTGGGNTAPTTALEAMVFYL